MRRNKILLGAAAAVMSAGIASAPAKAADVNGLVTTTVDYVASCAGGAGVTFNNTCVTLTGSVGATAGEGIKIDFNGGADNTTNGYNFVGAGISTSLSAKLKFSWQSGGYDVTISNVNPALWDPTAVRVDISRPGGIALHLRQNLVTVTMPFDAWKVKFGVETTGNLGVTLDVNGAFGDIAVGVGMVWTGVGDDPTFSGSLGFSLGDWDLTLKGATTDWGPLLPTASAALSGAFGDFKVDLFAGWEADGNDFAIAARGRTDLGGMAVHIAALYGQGDASWGGWTDDGGKYPYTLTPGDDFFAVWGGVSSAWNAEHTTALNVFYSNAISIADTQYARVGVTHTWKPVGGALTVTGNTWIENDFGGVGPVFGATLGVSMALIR